MSKATVVQDRLIAELNKLMDDLDNTVREMVPSMNRRTAPSNTEKANAEHSEEGSADQ